MKFETTSIPLFVVFIVQLVFFALKVTKAIDWSWLWVLAPLWMSYALAVVIAIFAILYLIAYKIKERIFNHE